MNYILFILMCMGISYSISTEMVTIGIRSWIKKKSNFLGDLIYCPICTGFWVGLILGIWITPLFFLADGFIILMCIKILEKITMNYGNKF